ncbi:hypothetical protein [Streptomyces sp. NPDC002640]
MVLVGHAYGGTVISQGHYGPGESSLGLMGKFPGSTLGQVVAREQFAADVAADKARLMATERRPIAAAALEENCTRAAWKTLPSWSLVTTEGRTIPVVAQRFRGPSTGRAGSGTDAPGSLRIRAHAVTDALPSRRVRSPSSPDGEPRSTPHRFRDAGTDAGHASPRPHGPAGPPGHHLAPQP